MPLLFNADVAISMARPRKEDAFFYRNGQGDEVVFVVEGEGVLESSFGDLPYRPGDYVVIPRGILHRWRLGQAPVRLLVIESAGYVRTPKTVPQRARPAHRDGALLGARHPPAARASSPTTRPASSRSW